MASANQPLSQKDSIVVVMGPTGAGKSTFIEFATGQNGGTIGHELKSCTAAIGSYKLNHPDYPDEDHPVVFVDTPGFDDTYKSDTEILAMIAEWLVKTYREHYKITTILYLHRITDNRMAGSAGKNLRLFIDMCGQDAMTNVIIVTTMWGEVREETGKKREYELKKDFWNGLLASGCQVKRFEDTIESAWTILGSADGKRAEFLLSKQMVDSRLPLNETRVGIALHKELEKLVKDRKAASRRLQELTRKQGDNEAVRRITLQQKEIEQKINSTLSQLRELKIPMARKFLRFFKY